MRSLVVLQLRGQPRSRLALVAGSAALVSTVLLVLVALLRLPLAPEERLFELVADTNLRPGVMLALLLLAAAVLLLLHQVVRLGTATRDRRLAVLRTVGATTGQVRLLGAAELGVPALVGALLGYGVYRALRLVLGGATEASDSALPHLGLIPTTVGPLWWDVLAVVLAVTAATAALGWSVSRAAVNRPLDAVRRVRSRPRPWPLGLLVVALLMGVGALRSGSELLLPVALAAAALLLAGPWLASWSGRRAERTASTVAVLLAGARLAADPYAAGRAAAPIGLIGLALGGASFVVALLVTGGGTSAFFVVSLLLVAVVVLLALLLVVLAITVNGIETLAEHRRSTATLAATGVPLRELSASLEAQARLVGQPAATLGLVVGTAAGLVALVVDDAAGIEAVAVLVGAVLTQVLLRLLVALAAAVVNRLLHPWLVAAAAPEALRTE